jgi:glutamyl-tRNA synthetase
MKKLYQLGLIYPCEKSRKDIRAHGLIDATGNEYLYPESFRSSNTDFENSEFPGTINWRFLTQSGKKVEFLDAKKAEQSFLVGKDISDFLVWRKDGLVAYELATVVDDYFMEITEVVRGEDLLLSSARQCLLFDALGWERPSFYHCKLLLGSDGNKLSKSTRSLPRLFSSS